MAVKGLNSKSRLQAAHLYLLFTYTGPRILTLWKQHHSSPLFCSLSFLRQRNEWHQLLHQPALQKVLPPAERRSSADRKQRHWQQGAEWELVVFPFPQQPAEPRCFPVHCPQPQQGNLHHCCHYVRGEGGFVALWGVCVCVCVQACMRVCICVCACARIFLFFFTL